MNWIYLIIAGFMEISGVIMLNEWKKKKTWWSGLGMVVGGILSVLLLTLAIRTIQIGTAYAVWTGIGTSGGTILGMIFYNESKDLKRILYIILVLIGVIGLKLTTA